MQHKGSLRNSHSSLQIINRILKNDKTDNIYNCTSNYNWSILLYCQRIVSFFRFTRPAFPVKDFGKRFGVMMNVAFGQTKIFRKPVLGFFHALVFWGFCVIIFGSIEMVIDGLTGTEKVLKIFGPVYDILMASGDIFALIVAISIIIFLSRRLFFHIKRFEGIEMKKRSHTDANISLSLILLANDIPYGNEYGIRWISSVTRRSDRWGLSGCRNYF